MHILLYSIDKRPNKATKTQKIHKLHFYFVERYSELVLIEKNKNIKIEMP